MTTPIKRYYPALAELLSLDDIPDGLSFIKDGLNNTLANLYYKDLQATKGALRDSAFYSLKVLSNKKLEFNILNTGFFIVLNRGEDPDTAAVPISLEYQWKILGAIKAFDASSFDEGAEAFLTVAKDALKLSNEMVLAQCLNEFTTPTNVSTTLIDQLITDVEGKYTGANFTSPNTIIELKLLAAEIESQTGVSLTSAIFNTYLLDGSSSENTWRNLRVFINSLLPTDIEEFVLDLIIPKVRVTLDLAASLEVPRSLLIPCEVNSNGELVATTEDPGDSTIPRAGFDFGSTTLYMDTEKGLGFDIDLSMSTTQPVMLGNTGIIAELDSLKVDLSENKNIPEADLDGRSPDFKGVYIASAAIHLPKDWLDFSENPDLTNPTISGKDLLVGTTGGFSGQLSLDTGGALNFKFLGTEIAFNTFSVSYKGDEVVNGSVSGKIIIPNLKDVSGNIAELDTQVMFFPGGYSVTVLEPEGIELRLGKLATITLKRLAIGKKDGEFFLELDANASRDFKMPFVDKLLPTGVNINPFAYHDGKVTANIKPEWDKESGVEGRVTPEGDIYLKVPLDMKDGSVLDLETLYINFFSRGADPGYAAQLLFDGKLNISQIEASAKKVGIQTNIIPADDGNGTFGPFDVGLELVPPERIALKIDFDQVKGQGFVWIKDGTYIGGLELEFAEKFGLTALAIIVTKLPDDEEGYSFLTIVTVSFPEPIAIGMGFNLKEVGGLLGLHRTMNIEYLREGLGSNSLGHILFPENIADNADRIVNAVTSAFPIKQKQYVVGPMFRLDYGLKVSLADIDLGLMIEFPDPVRIAIMGLVQMRLPKKKVEALAADASEAADATTLSDDEKTAIESNLVATDPQSPAYQAEYEAATALALAQKKKAKAKEAFNQSILNSKELVLLNIAFLGVIDFEQQMLSFDASIFQSRIQQLSIEGDIAVRLKWGEEPDFLISVGGFHPSYEPPAVLKVPKLKRIRIGLPQKEDEDSTVKAGIEAYMAVTANTVQFGAKLDVDFEKGSFHAWLSLWFDVIMHFKPFHFLANAGIDAGIEYMGLKIASIYIDLELQGPEPWIFSGDAIFTAFGKEVSKPIYYESGTKQVEKPEQVALIDEVEEAFDYQNNWTVELPERNELSVSLNELPNFPAALPPSGTIVYSQKAMPFNYEMTRFGNSQPKDFNKIWIDEVVRPNAQTSDPGFATLKEEGSFASTAFKDYTDDEKLSKPSFVKMESGVRIQSTASGLTAPYLNVKKLDHDDTLIDRGLGDGFKVLTETTDQAAGYARHRSSVAASQRSRSNQNSGLVSTGKVKRLGKTFAVFNKNNAQPYDAIEYTSLQAADEAKERLIDSNPNLEDKLYTGKKVA